MTLSALHSNNNNDNKYDNDDDDDDDDNSAFQLMMNPSVRSSALFDPNSLFSFITIIPILEI